MTRWLFARIAKAIRHHRHRPTFFQEQIARRTGETTFTIFERHCDAARSTPFTVAMVEEIDMVRVIGRPRMTLDEAIDRAAAAGWSPGRRLDLVKAIHDRGRR